MTQVPGPEQSDASYAELLWPLVLGGSAVGRLEWSTGVVSLDITHEVYASMSEARSQEQRRGATAYAHEMVHVFQLATCGFPFQWADQLRSLIQPALVRLRKDRRDDFAPVLEAMSLGSSAFTVEEASALRAHYGKIDAPNSVGLTTRCLMETHAFVVQRRMKYQVSGYSDLAQHLADAPSAEYRAAMDALAFTIGPTAAFEWFSLICAVALCTEHPAVSYNRILRALSDSPGLLPDTLAPKNALQAQRDLADLVEDDLIGSSAQAAEGRRSQRTPLTRLVSNVNRAANEGFDFIWCLAAPHVELVRLVQYLHVPVFLRPREPQGFAVQLPPGMERDTGLALLAVAATTVQLTRSIEATSRSVGAQAVAGLDWLQGDRQPVMFQLDLQALTEQDNLALLNLSDPGTNSAVSGREMARLWGRIVLYAPPELDPEGESTLSALPAAREYLNRLAEKFPAFPVVLAWGEGISGFVDWFGSLVPQAVHGNAVMVQHPALREAVEEATRAIYGLGERVGQNPTLVVQLLQSPLRRASIQ